MNLRHSSLLFAVSFTLGVTVLGMVYAYAAFSEMLNAREDKVSTRFQISGIIEEVSISDDVATVQVRMIFPNIPNVPFVQFTVTARTVIDVRRPLVEGNRVTGYLDDVLGSFESIQKGRLVFALLNITEDNTLQAGQLLLDDPLFHYNRQ